MEHENKNFIHDVTCPAVATKEVDICLPVSIEGFAHVGEIHSKCCGPAVIHPGMDCCPGEHDAVFKFVIRQKIGVAVPVTFGTKTKVGKSKVDFDDCECGHDKDGCCDDDDYDCDDGME